MMNAKDSEFLQSFHHSNMIHDFENKVGIT